MSACLCSAQTLPQTRGFAHICRALYQLYTDTQPVGTPLHTLPHPHLWHIPCALNRLRAYTCCEASALTLPDHRAHKQREGGETLEQHLSTWLAQKMGLRQMVREWRRNILAAVDAFYQQDPEIACLHRVLRSRPGLLQLLPPGALLPGLGGLLQLPALGMAATLVCAACCAAAEPVLHLPTTTKQRTACPAAPMRALCADQPASPRKKMKRRFTLCQPAWRIRGDAACIRSRLLTLCLLVLRHRVDEGMCHKLAAVRGAVKQAVAAAQPDLQVSAQGSITGPISPDAAQACLRYLLPDSQVRVSGGLLM